MMQYRHIVWDWNGTLLDDVQASVNTINQLLAVRSLPRTDASRYRELFGFPVRNYYTAIGFRLENENWDLLARTYHDIYLASATPMPAMTPPPFRIPIIRGVCLGLPIALASLGRLVKENPSPSPKISENRKRLK